MDHLRILESRRRWKPEGKHWLSFPYYEVLSQDFKEVLSEHKTFLEASQELERIVRQERIACPSGGCED